MKFSAILWCFLSITAIAEPIELYSAQQFGDRMLYTNVIIRLNAKPTFKTTFSANHQTTSDDKTPAYCQIVTEMTIGEIDTVSTVRSAGNELLDRAEAKSPLVLNAILHDDRDAGCTKPQDSYTTTIASGWFFSHDSGNIFNRKNSSLRVHLAAYLPNITLTNDKGSYVANLTSNQVAQALLIEGNSSFYYEGENDRPGMPSLKPDESPRLLFKAYAQ